MTELFRGQKPGAPTGVGLGRGNDDEGLVIKSKAKPDISILKNTYRMILCPQRLDV